MELDIKSNASAEEVARLVRVVESGCFVLQTLTNPMPVKRTVTLNGQPLAVGAADDG